MILELREIAYSYGGNEVLKDVSFKVDEKDKVGIVGPNGCGKTTLLRCITGELTPQGSVFIKNGARIGYVAQTAGLSPDGTVRSEMKDAVGTEALLSAMNRAAERMADDPEQMRLYTELAERFDAIGGYDADYNIARILTGMSFPESTWGKRTAVLSGGEKTRLALAKLLVQAPDLLILDEPTNHLDMATVEWLEDFVSGYKGAVIVVSHDRWFLDRVTNRTVELIAGKSLAFDGGYTEFCAKRDFYFAERNKEYERNVKTAEKLQDFVDRNLVRASTSNMAKSRIKMISRLDLERPDDPEHDDVRFTIRVGSDPYKEVLTARDVAVSAGGKELISGIDFVLERGERLSVVGENGTGKTTFLKCVTGETRPSEGFIRRGGGVVMSYFKQNLFTITAKDPMSFIWDRYPTLTPLEVRKLLASVGFRGEDVFTDASGLSGGELAKLNLLLISMQQPNLLVLDEPTDHLDIYTKEILDNALAEYTGAVLAVSHDRWFLKKLGGRVMAFENGTAVIYEDYEKYLHRNDEPAAPAGAAVTRRPEDPSKEGRRERAKRREQISLLEKQIAELEQRESELRDASTRPENISDHVRLHEIFTELDEVSAKLAEVSEQWLEISDN